MTSPTARPGASPPRLPAPTAGAGIVVLDVGNVLLPIAAGAHARALGEATRLPADQVLVRLVRAGIEQRFECGRMDTAGMVEAVRDCLEAPWLSASLVQRAWDAVVDTAPDPTMTRVARDLAAQGRLLLASNTNESHWRLISQRLEEGGLRAPAVLSYRVGAMKPDGRFFDHVLARLPEATDAVFLDDRPENVTAAADAGLPGWVHVSADDSVRRLDVAPPTQATR